MNRSWKLPLAATIAATVFAALVFADDARVQQTQGKWITDSRTGCRAWNLRPEPDETIIWHGACNNGLAHGVGLMQWFRSGGTSAEYYGDYRDGHMNGRGIWTMPDGTRYEGEVSDDLQNGLGTFISPAHGRYDGEWRDGKQHGRGIFTYANGDIYDGEWRNGKPHGHGVHIGISGARFEGKWRDGKAEGIGTLWASDGQVYHGAWFDGCFNDNGRKAYAGRTRSECGLGY